MKPAAGAEARKVAAVGRAALQPSAGCGMEKIKYEQLSVKTFRASYCYERHLFLNGKFPFIGGTIAQICAFFADIHTYVRV